MSSDSDDEQLRAKKAKPSGMRARRGFSKKKNDLTLSLSTKDTIPTSSAIYSTCVSRCFNNIKSHELEEEMNNALADTTDDVEDDLLSRCSKKTTPPTLLKKDTVLLLSDNEDDENCQNLQNTSSNIATPSPPPPPSPPAFTNQRHRRGGKQKKNLMKAVNNLTKNLSDAQSQLQASQQFQSPEPDVYMIDGTDEVTVRINHMGQIHRYSLNPDDSFSMIITQVATKEKVPDKCVMLVHNDKTLRPTDSPLSVKLHTADIISCHINQNAEDSFNDSLTFDIEDANLIELVVQTRGSKHKELIKAHLNKPLSILMSDYAKRVKKDLNSLQFVFDGDVVGNQVTPMMLDMEDGDILDVNVHTVELIS